MTEPIPSAPLTAEELEWLRRLPFPLPGARVMQLFATIDQQAELVAQLRAEKAALATAQQVFEAIAHGDDDHRDWLKEACENIWAGKEVPEPRGKNTNADLQARLASAQGALREIARNGTKYCSRAPIIAQAELKGWEEDKPNPFGQAECAACGWANHDVRKKCRNCGAALGADHATEEVSGGSR